MSEKAPVLKLKRLIEDGLENLVASLGAGQDKRQFSKFVNKKMLSMDGNQVELDAMYRTDWLCGKVVDIVPNDMTREWRSFDSDDIDPDTVEDLENEEKRLHLVHKFNSADKWARLYGTGFIVMNIDDGQTPDQPLNIDAVKEGGLKWINAIDRHRVSRDQVVPIADPLDAAFGFPELYRFNETSVTIHHSRVLRFDGIMLPFDEFRRNNYWGMSVLERLYDAVIDFNTTTRSTSSMVYEATVDVVKVKGLMAYLQTSEGEKNIRKRFSLASMLKSINNMLLLDSEEDYEKKTQSFSGLGDLIMKYAELLSAATDIPATRLLGSSASGLNATGEGDLKNYYDMIASKQTFDYSPKLDYFDQIMAKSLGLSDDTDLSYEWNSLFQMTDKETADMEFVNAQRDAIYIDRGVVPEEAVAKELKQEGVYTNIDDDWIKELEENGGEFGELGTTEEIEPGQAPQETQGGAGGEGSEGGGGEVQSGAAGTSEET